MGGSDALSEFYTPPSPLGERTENYIDLCNTIPATCAFSTYFASYKRIDILTLSCYNKAKKGGADMIENVWIDKSIASAKH